MKRSHLFFLSTTIFVCLSNLIAIANDIDYLTGQSSYTPRTFKAETNDPIKELYQKREDSRKAEEEKIKWGLPETFFLSIAPAYCFDFGSEFNNDGGVGISFSGLFDIQSDEYKQFHFLFGVEGIVLHGETNLEEQKQITDFTSVNLALVLGGRYLISEHVGIGGLLGYGYGPIYGTLEKKLEGNIEKNNTGNLNSIFTIKPFLETHINNNLSIFTAYRLSYISPNLASKATNWNDLDLFSHSIEVGFTYRF